MESIRRFIHRLTHSNNARKAARSHLKAAKHENSESFLALAANYIDLAHTYYACTVSETPAMRMARVTQLFLGLWQNLLYAERLSDFEFMLAEALIKSTDKHSAISNNKHVAITSKKPLVMKLRMLSPQTRFACLAYAFGKWPLHWVALVMRMKSTALHKLLSEARCKLCGINWESLSDEERACLVAVSASLDKSPDLRTNKALCQRIRDDPRVHEIKAQWLELRPELVEVRICYTPSLEERELLLKYILGAIVNAPMQRPQLVDRMVNSVHFSRHTKTQSS
jgi:hypothetical protein